MRVPRVGSIWLAARKLSYWAIQLQQKSSLKVGTLDGETGTIEGIILTGDPNTVAVIELCAIRYTG